MYRNAFFGLLAILLVFGFIGCASLNVVLDLSDNLVDTGIILAGDTIGNFSHDGPGSPQGWRFLLTEGEGATDNHLFEIVNRNVLRARINLSAREYSVRVKVIGTSQDVEAHGIQDIFTFTVINEPR
jgi:hypothetical protein